MRLNRDRRGIAIIVVLLAIVVMTMIGVEFAYSTSVDYNIAVNERNRLQAYYLARSGYNFMRLELMFGKTFKQIVEKQNLGQYLGASATLPLCQQFPMSTALIREVFMGGGMPGDDGGAAAGEGEETPKEEESVAEKNKMETMKNDVSMSEENVAKEFLSFKGDFDGECVDESVKINLNSFSTLSNVSTDPAVQSPADQYKQFLFRLFTRPEFETLFKDAGIHASDVINNIGDWVDSNTEVNEFGGKSGGAERSLYDRLGVKYSVRNAKMVTPMEIFLIDGIDDQWFGPVQDLFTIYGDGKVNVCNSKAEILESLIRRYVDSNPNLPPVRLEDPEEMRRIVTAAQEPCSSGKTGAALVTDISSKVTAAIGGGAAPAPAPQQPVTPDPQNPQAASAPAPQPVSSNFASYITAEPRYFTIKVTGSIQDTIVRIKAVLDSKEADPKKWKLLYWRVY